jgi:hypothetical protein
MANEDPFVAVLAAHEPGRGATCRCGWAADRRLAFKKGGEVPKQHRAHVAATLRAAEPAVAETVERVLLHRGVCTCGEVDKENRLGHADGCRYFSDSVYAAAPTADPLAVIEALAEVERRLIKAGYYGMYGKPVDIVRKVRGEVVALAAARNGANESPAEGEPRNS